MQILQEITWNSDTCFPVKFARYLRIHFFQKTFGRLLLWLLLIIFSSNLHSRQLTSDEIFAAAATRGILEKKTYLKILQNSQENTCSRVSFLVKLQAWGTRACVFQWILRIYLEHLFYKTPPGDCFCISNYDEKVYLAKHWQFIHKK